MLLYDIIYPGNSMDRAIPLSSASEVEGAKAQCVNGDPRDARVFRGGKWEKS